MWESISNFWELSGLNMQTILTTILAIAAGGFGLWRFFEGGWAWNWLSGLAAKAKNIRTGTVAASDEPAFETLLDAVDRLAHDESLDHDKRFEFAAEALNLAKRASGDVPPVQPTEIVVNG